MIELFTGLVSVSPGSKGREMMEKQITGYQMHSGYDGLDFWSRPHRLTCFFTLGTITATISGSGGWIVMYMTPTPLGLPPWVDPPNFPLCLIRYAVDNPIDGQDERFELVTAPGDGVTPMLVTRLVGTDPPRSPISPGGQRTQRYELVYMPDQYVSALISGKEGARHTTSLPLSGTVPGFGANFCGLGVYLHDGNINNSARAAFHSFMVETYRP
jgi:hypothetical protein